MTRLLILVGVVCLLFLFSVVLIPFANADWIMFRSNPSHSGVGTGNTALAHTLLWKYSSSSAIEQSPGVVDGVLYIGSFDDNVYALNATSGTKLWNYSTGGPVFSSPAVVNDKAFIG